MCAEMIAGISHAGLVRERDAPHLGDHLGPTSSEISSSLMPRLASVTLSGVPPLSCPPPLRLENDFEPSLTSLLGGSAAGKRVASEPAKRGTRGALSAREGRVARGMWRARAWHAHRGEQRLEARVGELAARVERRREHGHVHREVGAHRARERAQRIMRGTAQLAIVAHDAHKRVHDARCELAQPKPRCELAEEPHRASAHARRRTHMLAQAEDRRHDEVDELLQVLPEDGESMEHLECGDLRLRSVGVEDREEVWDQRGEVRLELVAQREAQLPRGAARVGVSADR